MDEYYWPVAKLMVLTGLIASEIAALKSGHVRDGYLYVDYQITERSLASPRHWQTSPV